jgi:adenylate kinase
MLRAEVRKRSALGKKVRDYLERGLLVPDKIMIEILKRRIKRPDCAEGFILDGFPRGLGQAMALEGIAEIDAVINLIVPEKIIIARLSNRRTCAKCGDVYNLWTGILPKIQGICDKCGGRLVQRPDERPAVVKKRLKVYHSETEPVIKYYRAKGLLINIRWKRAYIPAGAVDVPPELMIKDILDGLKSFKKIRAIR